MGMYKSYICLKCKNTSILLKEEIMKDRYLVCPHCSSRNIVAESETDNLKECMSHTAYKREHGYIRQVRK